ncbi:mucin-2-like isoform X2 [Sardina pilchardus]|uniref:mucin-2-like isoform X2 n=1 Tax=Sardina pilchardus TaxID=27697 RepID=UPI002E157DE0
MDRCNTTENMGVDFYQNESRPIKPPAIPPKKTSLYQTPRDPETPSKPLVNPKPFPQSPTSLTSSPTPQYLSPHQSATHDSPNTYYGSADLDHPVSPRPVSPRPVSPRPVFPRPVLPPPVCPRPVSPHPVSPHPACPPAVPSKSNIYLRPNALTSSDTSHGGRAPSPVSFSSTERELGPSPQTALRPPHSPSVPRRPPGPHRTQSQKSEGSVATESTLTSPSPKPRPSPRTRRISAGTQSPTSATPHTSPEEIPLLSEQVSRTHVTSQQPVEYDTLWSENQTVPTPPPIPPKLRTLDRLPLTPMTQDNYDRPSRPERPSSIPRCTVSHADQHYQAPVGSLDNNSNNVNTTQNEHYQAPRPGCPAPEASGDSAVCHWSPNPGPRLGYTTQMPGSPSASLKQLPCQSAIYETTETPSELQKQSSGNAPARPPPPTFSPPPPPTPSATSPFFSPPMGRKSEYSRTYLEVLPGDSGYEGSIQGTIYKSAPRLSGTLPTSSPVTLPRSSSEPLFDKREVEQEPPYLSKWKMMGMHLAPISRYSRPMTAGEKIQWLNQTAQRAHKSLTYFQSMLPGRRTTLRWHISELREIAGKLEKASQKNKMMGIGGGTGGAVGGVTAVVGIALAPVTMGISLIATAVGTGVAVAAGGMGASSAMKKKKNKGAERKKSEEIMKMYRDQVIDLEESLAMARSGMEELRQHDLTGASEEAVWMAHVAEAASRCGKAASVKTTLTDDILKEFDVFPDVYYSISDGEKQKKSTDKMYASKVRTVAEQLQEGLNSMNCALETLSLAKASV